MGAAIDDLLVLGDTDPTIITGWIAVVTGDSDNLHRYIPAANVWPTERIVGALRQCRTDAPSGRRTLRRLRRDT